MLLILSHISITAVYPGVICSGCHKSADRLLATPIKNYKLVWPVGAGILRNAESCQGVICGKSNAEHSANYPLSLFRIPQPKNSAFPRIAKVPFAVA